MMDNLRQLAHRVESAKKRLGNLKDLEAPASMITKEDARYRAALAEFNYLAEEMGLNEFQKKEILREIAEYIKSWDLLQEYMHLMPSNILFRQFMNFGSGWSFAGVSVIIHEEDQDLENNPLNKMTLAELEKFLETNPGPDDAMHALGIMANSANEWSVDLLIEFRLLANRFKNLEEENIPKEEAAKMVYEVISRIEKALD